MVAFLQFIILISAINLIETTTFLPISNVPASDLIINTDKAFALQRIGPYSSKLKEEIVHTFVPLDDLCTTSPKTDLCVFTSDSTSTNLLGIGTILPSRDTITALPEYDKDQISNVVQNDISRALRLHRPDEFIAKTNSIIHLIEDQFRATNIIKKSLLDSTKFLINSNQSDIPHILPSSSTLILRQITNNKIGFDFLTNAELMLFLTAALSTIDKSYQIIDISESLSLFSQLIIAQYIYILRSCSNHQEHISTSQSCLIISTLFLRPSIDNNVAFPIYRFISLPAIVNNEQYMYSNMPEAIGINEADQSVILWENAPKKNECLFSIFVYCQKKPPSIRLYNPSCLSELFSTDTRIVSSCQITRSRKIQTDIINIDNNIWLFSHNGEPLYCHLQSNTGEFNAIIAIDQPSIIRMPCGSTVKCPNTELASSTCTNRSVLIKSTVSGKYENLSTIPWPIKNMIKQLLSTYQLSIKDSLKDILDDLRDNRLTATSAAKEFGSIILSIFFLLLLSLILFFIRWIKRMVQKRIDKLEKDLDDLVHELV